MIKYTVSLIYCCISVSIIVLPVCDVFFLVSSPERTHLLLSGSHVSLVAALDANSTCTVSRDRPHHDPPRIYAKYERCIISDRRQRTRGGHFCTNKDYKPTTRNETQALHTPA